MPYIFALLSIGLVTFVVCADCLHQLFDLPESEQELVVLTVNTVSPKQQDEGYWLPISALTKDYDNNWAVYSVEPQSDHEVVVRHEVYLKRVEQERALIAAPNVAKKRNIMADGLHLVVPGQVVQSSKYTGRN